MKRIILAMLFVWGLFFLFGCEETAYEDFAKTQSSWETKDKLIRFEFQGIKGDYGLGTVKVKSETINVVVLLDDLLKQLTLVRYADVYQDVVVSNYMVFDIFYEDNPLSILEQKISIRMIENNSADEALNHYEETIFRSYLNNNQLNAKNYAGTSWRSSDYGLELYSNIKSDFTKILLGVIVYEDLNMNISFHFKDDQMFQVFHEETLIMSGSYQTEGLNLKLVLETNLIYKGLESLQLVGFAL